MSAFLILLFCVIYGINYLKEHTSFETASDKSLNEQLAKEIESTDRTISHILFKSGVSKDDIAYKSTILRDESVSWKYQEIIVNQIEEPEAQAIITGLRNTIPSDSYKLVSQSDGTPVFEVSVSGRNSHRLIFNVTHIPTKHADRMKSVKKQITSHEEAGDGEVVHSELSDKPMVAIIVDDLGQDRYSVDRLIELSRSLTFAILPDLPNSVYAAEMARQNGIETMLHIPMEPKLISGYSANDAGEKVLMTGQSVEAVLLKLNEIIDSVPYITGANNHMGSKFTENAELMRLVLTELKRHELFFVDSLTTPHSKGYTIAREIGLKTVKRDVFLDERARDSQYVAGQIEKLVEKAQSKGYAVGICHPYPQTLEALEQELPRIREHVRLVPVSQLVY